MVTDNRNPNRLTPDHLRRSRRGTLGAFPSDDLYEAEDASTGEGLDEAVNGATESGSTNDNDEGVRGD